MTSILFTWTPTSPMPHYLNRALVGKKVEAISVSDIKGGKIYTVTPSAVKKALLEGGIVAANLIESWFRDNYERFGKEVNHMFFTKKDDNVTNS